MTKKETCLAVLLSAALFSSPAGATDFGVFVSSTTHAGDFGDLAAADQICTDLATGAGLGGTWVAWLSTANVYAKDRLTEGTFVRATEPSTTIATSIADLIDQTIGAPILYDEYGATPTDLGAAPWTGTIFDGTNSPIQTCLNWTDVDASGLSGNSALSDLQWTDGAFSSCLDERSIYCFQTSLPVQPPTVTNIYGNGTRTIDSCDTVNAELTELTVLLDHAGENLLGEDFAGSYLLVKPGPDRTFATDSCSSGAAVDDQAIGINGTLVRINDAVSTFVDLQLDSALDAGLYRLLVCDTITSGIGVPLDGDGDGSPGGDYLLPFFRIDPRNLFENGHFDNCPPTLDPWVTLATAPNAVTTGSTATDDHQSSPLSASVEIAHSAPDTSSVAQCVDVNEDVTYSLEHRVRFSPLASALGRLESTCEFFDSTSCAGSSLGASSSASILEDGGGAWIWSVIQVTAPSGAVSALCDVSVEPLGSDPNFDLHLDGLAFRGPAPGPAPDGENYTLSDATILDSQTIHVGDTITVGPNVAVHGPNGNLTLKGLVIAIQDDFSVLTDGTLTIQYTGLE